MRTAPCLAVVLLGIAGVTAANARDSGDAFPSSSGGRFLARGLNGADHPLALQRFSAQVTTRPGVVRSTVILEFASELDEQAEAIMRLAIPPGAAVTGAALWVDGVRMPGVLAGRDRATEIYQSIVSRRRDPALVTWDGPGWLTVSVFPLEPRATRRFELEWVEPAANAHGRIRYRVPTVMHGSRFIGRAELEVDGHKLARSANGIVTIARGDAPAVVTQRDPGDLLQQMMVRGPAERAPPRFVLVAETSAAMTADDRRAQRAAIDALLEKLPAGSRVTMMTADWDRSTLIEAAEASRWPEALTRMDAVVSAGSLHLERALRNAAMQARRTRADAVLFAGHGEGAFTTAATPQMIQLLHDAGVRLSVLDVVAAQVGAPALADAAALTGGVAVKRVVLADALPALVQALRPLPDPPAAKDEAPAVWRALETIDGQTVWIGRGPQALRAPNARAGFAADLAPLWDRARLGWPDGWPNANGGTSAALTPMTSLLVLERDEDYLRWGLARGEPGYDGPASTLVPSRATRPSRTAVAVEPRAPAPAPPRTARAPEVFAGEASVRGALDKEIIRRAVRRHMQEVKYCYEEELRRAPTLAGRITIKLTIEPSGHVSAAVVERSTLDNPRVEGCVRSFANGWLFPAVPSGGAVVVSYPFVLLPTGAFHPDGEDAEALAILAGGQPLADRLRRISRGYGLSPLPDPRLLAFAIESRRDTPQRLLLVARLLVVAGRRTDAIRVLTEGAPFAPDEMAAELRRIDAGTDADEVVRLAAR